MDLGVTYIPWEKVKVDDLDGFAEGGIIDQETVNDGMKNTLHTSMFGKGVRENVQLNINSTANLVSTALLL